MDPKLKTRIMHARRKLSDAEQQLAPMIGLFKETLKTELAVELMNTLHNLILAHLAKKVSRASVKVFVAYIADELNVSAAAVNALAEYKLASYEFGLTLHDVDPSSPQDWEHGRTPFNA